MLKNHVSCKGIIKTVKPKKKLFGSNKVSQTTTFYWVSCGFGASKKFLYPQSKSIFIPICSTKSFVSWKFASCYLRFLLFLWWTAKKAWMILSMHLQSHHHTPLLFFFLLSFEEDRISITSLECASFYVNEKQFATC